MSARSPWPAPVLLVLLGVLFGAILIVAKVGQRAGMPFLGLALWQALGAGLALLAVRRPWPILRRRSVWRYGLVAGLVGIAVPNSVLFAVVPHIGAGLASVFYTFSPALSLAMAHAAGLQRADRRTMLGLALGLAGAMLVVGGGAASAIAQPAWLAVAALAPVSLALGNVWRTRAWPDGADPDDLAAVTLLFAALILFPIALATGRPPVPIPVIDGAVPTAVLAGEAVLTALAYAVLLRLQRLAGPVYLSQIGYIIAAAGLVLGAVLLGEPLPLTVIPAVALVVIGASLVRTSQHHLGTG